MDLSGVTLELATAMNDEVMKIGNAADCGVVGNWISVVSLSLLENSLNFNKVINDMCNCTLPVSMQGIFGIKILLKALDPTEEYNSDDDNKKQLYKILTNMKGENLIISILKPVLNKISNDAAHEEAAVVTELLKKIETFLTTTHPRPRGRPKDGFSWNSNWNL